MAKTHFSFARQIQPRDGNILLEFPDGITIEARKWDEDRHYTYPRAERQVTSGFALVLDEHGMLFEVAKEEIPFPLEFSYDG